MLKVGDTAPRFAALNQTKQWSLVYFYPKDDTPGCTTEACGFRDAFSQLKNKATIIGVSRDSEKSHEKFAQKYHLQFPLVSDPDRKIIDAYGAWGKKKFMGREFDGILRISYLINPEGKIAKVYPKVSPADHASEILADLKELTQ